jgi:D-tyrosyl-tRNA(Tyr) deacylase
MKAVLQRVSEAKVMPEGGVPESIGPGLLILLGVAEDDDDGDIEWLCEKICHLRIFDDKEGVMNLSVTDTGGGLMVVSQFTLMASVRKGKRPSYVIAAGRFGAHMDVSLTNDGPVTILLDSKRKE